MSNRIRLRRGTEAEWTAADPILASGEVGYETDTGRAKVGDGIQAWTELAYRFETGGAPPDGSVTSVKLGGDVTTAGKALLTAADAAAQRTALGISSTLVIENRTDDPGSPEVGRVWLRTDL